MPSILDNATSRLWIASPCLSVNLAKRIRTKILEGIDVKVITTTGSRCDSEHIKSLCILGYWKKIAYPSRRLEPNSLLVFLTIAGASFIMYLITHNKYFGVIGVSSLLIAGFWALVIGTYILIYYLAYIRPSKNLNKRPNFELCIFDELAESLIIIDNNAYVEEEPLLGEFNHESVHKISLSEATKKIYNYLENCKCIYSGR